jgi:hypothetical protein
MNVVFTANIILVVGDVLIDSETLLVTDFMNLKIKSVQSFGGAHNSRVCVRIFIGMSARMCMSICVCTVFLKKNYRIEREREKKMICLARCSSMFLDNTM